MIALRTMLKSLISTPGRAASKLPSPSCVGGIQPVTLSELRQRERRIYKASLVLLGANVLALGLLGAFSLIAHFSTLDPKISRLEVPANVYKVIEAPSREERLMRSRFPLHYAVMDNRYQTVASLLDAAQLPADERRYVIAQLDLVRGNTGTLAQKMVVADLRKGNRLTAAEGQWIYAMEMAAYGHVETEAAVDYKDATLRAGQAWSSVAAISTDVGVGISLVTILCSTLSFILRRRIERIDAMLKLLA